MEETLRESLLREYGLRAEEAQPVSGGWLNEKWKIASGGETWLVKRFSAHRYDAQNSSGWSARFRGRLSCLLWARPARAFCAAKIGPSAFCRMAQPIW